MSIRFAAAGSGECAIVARVLGRTRRLPRAANDSDGLFRHDTVVHQALRHFAAHGLHAAERARQNAENAFFAGDRGEYHRWMAILRALDRRLANAAAQRSGARGLRRQR